MADMPTAPAWTLIDVKKVEMLLLSHLRCRFQVLELFLGRFLARKDEFATPGEASKILQSIHGSRRRLPTRHADYSFPT
jgi:hypothetical protein